jgi:hypothetical protein
MRARLAFVVFIACQIALVLGNFGIVSWWDGG